MVKNLAIVLLAVVCLLLSVRTLRMRLQRRRTLNKAAWGRRAETEIGAHLEKQGYESVIQHPSVRYVWRLDGADMSVNATPDWLVEKDGQRFLVEVKTGAQANPNLAAIRRQLLEYATYGDVDGVLFVNGDTGSVQRVEFPVAYRTVMPTWAWRLIGGLAAALVAAIAFATWPTG
ncbi:MAG: hypothetical protein ACON3Z_20040 [Bradymonadia bacterium]